MAAIVKTKLPMERRIYPFALANKMGAGAVITAVQAFISRAAPPLGVFPLQATTLATASALNTNTVRVVGGAFGDPRAGALLILEPGTANEETLKVVSTTPTGGDFDCVVRPVTFIGHNTGVSVSFEPGESARMLVNATPTGSGTNVSVEVQHGCDSQKYRLSVVATCNDGQIVEDEATLEVQEPVITESPGVKQPTEEVFVASEMDDLMEEPHQAGATISSATAFASLVVAVAPVPTLAAQATRGTTTISLSINPGIGGKLVLTPAGSGAAPPERVYVENVTGSGPFSVTVNPPLEFTHNNGVQVTTFLGLIPNLLSSASSTIAGKTVKNLSRRGRAGTQVQLTWLATTSQLERLQHNALLNIQED
jgi:hypothetical protein